ncbi:hypothetical protein SDJN03_29891, partial [Cucurbita argyrosperma subsp. sororia]
MFTVLEDDAVLTYIHCSKAFKHKFADLSDQNSDTQIHLLPSRNEVCDECSSAISRAIQPRPAAQPISSALNFV